MSFITTIGLIFCASFGITFLHVAIVIYKDHRAQDKRIAKLNEMIKYNALLSDNILNKINGRNGLSC